MNAKILTENRIEYISILRVLGMFSIVFCHLFGYLNISFIQQFLNFGVYLFLLISGFLYGNKEIKNYKSWFLSRIKKLLIPFYIFAIPVMIFYYCHNSIDVFEIIKYLFCLQGINFIFAFIPFSEIEPLGNLWFITVIMLCYLLIIPIKKAEKNHASKKWMVVSVITIIFFVPLISSYFGLLSINTSYFVVFFVGYYISKYRIKVNAKLFVIFGVLLFAFAIILRLTGKHFFDENYQSIYQIIVSITHPLIAISCFFIFNFITNKIKIMKSLANSGVWATIDKYSYYIYITHYAFLHSVTSVANFNLNSYFTVLLFFVFTIFSAIILQYLSEKIQKVIH